MKLNTHTEEIINLWNSGNHTLQSIAIQYNASKVAIKYLLNRHNINTYKKSRKSIFTCDTCGKQFSKPFSQDKYIHNYCSQNCYHTSMHNPNYNQNRQGQRIARERISTIFNLSSTHVVHHIDGNCLNNNLSNLMVFQNQSDHLKYHRGQNIEPIFKLM